VKDLNYWTYIVIEGYCMINTDYNSKHSKYTYELLDLDKNDGEFKTKKLPNPDYDPNIKRPNPPNFCTRRICYDCLAKECEYFAYADGGKDEGRVKVIELITDDEDEPTPKE